MRVMGINTGHDATVTLVEDGRIVLNLELERFTKVKNDYGYSEEFVRLCLDRAGWRVSDIDLMGLHSIWDKAHDDFKGFCAADHGDVPPFVELGGTSVAC